MHQSDYSSHIANLCISLLRMSQGSVGPDQIYSPEAYSELLQLGGWGGLIFQRKDEAKRFSAEIFPILQTHAPYLLSHAAKRSTLIISHGPPMRNFPEDISLSLQWTHNCFSPVYPSYLWANPLWIFLPQYNRRDNAPLCTPKPHYISQIVAPPWGCSDALK